MADGDHPQLPKVNSPTVTLSPGPAPQGLLGQMWRKPGFLLFSAICVETWTASGVTFGNAMCLWHRSPQGLVRPRDHQPPGL